MHPDIVVCELLAVEAVTGKDKLKKCTVSDGEKEFTVVSNAPNVLPEKVGLPKVSLPGTPDLGELAEPAGPFAGIKATFQTAGVGAVLGGLVGAKVGWEARGAAVAAGNAKDAVVSQLAKAQKAMK